MKGRDLSPPLPDWNKGNVPAPPAPLVPPALKLMMTWRFIFTTAKEQSSVTARVKRSKFVTGEAVIGGKGFSKGEKRGEIGNLEFHGGFEDVTKGMESFQLCMIRHNFKKQCYN